MKTIEEQLWSYIDGTCTTDESKAIAELIAADETWGSKYADLLSFDQQLESIELDEPSMGFTFKVMEGIRGEYAQQPLNAKINQNIISVIAAFFIISITALLLFLWVSVPLGHANMSNGLPQQLKHAESFLQNPETKFLHGTTLLNIFLMVDIVLALFLTDAYLRRKKASKQALRP